MLSILFTVVIIICIITYSRKPEFFQNSIEYQDKRNELLKCQHFDCLYNKEKECNTYCKTLDNKTKEKRCAEQCYDMTDERIDHIKYQESIFGNSYYKFNHFIIQD